MDHRSSAHDALRPVRVDRALLGCSDRQLRRARWKVELVGRNDLDVLVRFKLPIDLGFFSAADVSCWNVGILLWQWCSGFTLEQNQQDSSLAPPEAADRLSRFSGCLTILSARFGRQIFIPDEPFIRSLVSAPIRCLPPPAYMISFLYSLPIRPPTRNHPPPPISPRF